MKLFYSIFMIFVALSISFAQTKTKKVNVKWGKIYKGKRTETVHEIMGHDNSAYYLTRSIIKLFKVDYFIDKYNKDLNRIQSQKLVLKDNDKKRDYEFSIYYNDKIYLFSSFKNQKLKKNYLFMQNVDKKTLALSNNLTKIAEIDYEGKSRLNSGAYNSIFSKDSSKFLIYYDLPYSKKTNEIFGFHVFDNKMTEIWKKQISLPYEDKLFEIEDYIVDSKGNVHLLGALYKKKVKSKRKGKPNYKFIILSYFNNGKDVIEYPIQLKEKFITDMKMAVDKKGDIVCAGFYSEKETFSIKGSYYLKIDKKTKKIKSKSLKEFGADFITQNMKKGKKKRKTRRIKKGKNIEMYEYDLDKIEMNKDGSAYVIGEQYFIRTVVTHSTTADGQTTTRTTTYFFYNDIIVIKINENGDIEWTEKIAKRQASSNDGGYYLSYTYAKLGEKLYFFFSDNPKNLFYKGEGKVKNVKLKKALFLLVELDSTGKQKREAVFNVKGTKVYPRPKVSKQINKKEILLYGEKKKKKRLAKIKFN